MIWVHPDDVAIPENRLRRQFDEKQLGELKDSILRNGLFHPPVVERTGDTWVLRAGERRLRALKAIITEGGKIRVGDIEGVVEGENPVVESRQTVPNESNTLIPVNEYGRLTELQRLEIEVEENVVRSDFTWDERALGYTKLHELRVKQDPSHTVTETATEILGKPAKGSQVSTVSQALVLAKHMHIPEVAKAKDAKSALKVIDRIAAAGHRAKLVEASLGSATLHKLIKGDTRVILPSLPTASFDVVITDPPYGVDAHQFGDMASTGHDYKDTAKHWNEIMGWLPDELFRVTKERAHVYIFCDIRNFERLATLMVLANFTVFPTPLVWSKSNGMLPFPEHGPRRTYETILYAWKGDRKVLKVAADVIDITGVKKLSHGAQKPVALYAELLSRSASPGDDVLDCFGGSGPVLPACNKLGLTATYIEMEEDAFNIATLRKDEKAEDDGAVELDGLEDIPL